MSVNTQRHTLVPRDPRSARALGLVVLTAALCAPLLAWSHHRAAGRAQDAAVAEHASIASQARRLLTLRDASDVRESAHNSVNPGEPGAGAGADLVARLRAVMAEVGLSASALRDARQAEPVMLRGANAGLARLSGSATITSISPADAARLLALWREQEPAWAVRSLALRASQTRSRPGEIVDLFDLDLSFEAVAPGAPGAPGAPTAAKITTPTSPEARS